MCRRRRPSSPPPAPPVDVLRTVFNAAGRFEVAGELVAHVMDYFQADAPRNWRNTSQKIGDPFTSSVYNRSAEHIFVESEDIYDGSGTLTARQTYLNGNLFGRLTLNAGASFDTSIQSGEWVHKNFQTGQEARGRYMYRVRMVADLTGTLTVHEQYWGVDSAGVAIPDQCYDRKFIYNQAGPVSYYDFVWGKEVTYVR